MKTNRTLDNVVTVGVIICAAGWALRLFDQLGAAQIIVGVVSLAIAIPLGVFVGGVMFRQTERLSAWRHRYDPPASPDRVTSGV